MAAPKLDGLFRGLLHVDCHYLETAASVSVPEVFEMRSLRIALASPGSEEIEQDHLTTEIGNAHRGSVRRGELDFGQAAAWSKPGVRSPPQIGDQDRSANCDDGERDPNCASHLCILPDRVRNVGV